MAYDCNDEGLFDATEEPDPFLDADLEGAEPPTDADAPADAYPPDDEWTEDDAAKHDAWLKTNGWINVA